MDHLIKTTGFIFCLIFLTNSCSKESNQLNNPDLIFFDSYHLQIKPYTYADDNEIFYHLQGDTIYYTNIADTLNNMPLLKWDSIKYGTISVAIFTAPIKVINNNITNYKEIIWQWHSGMEFVKEGEVKYSQGKYVSNGIIDYNHELQPLFPGDYYWAVWGWNSECNKVLYSSRQMHFHVKE
jgi:hypothetical protein